MIDNEYSTSDYQSSNISFRAVMKNPGMLKFVPDHLKTKQTRNYAVKKLPFVMRFVSDRYKTKKCVIKLF